MEPLVRGYRGDVGDVRALLAGAPRVQPMRADRIHGADHLRLAALLADRAVAQGRARSADLATETLLYAAGERQVGRALERLGLEPGAARAVALVAWADAADVDAWAARAGWTRDDEVLDGDDSVLEAFGIGADERALVPRERWGDLVLERVALVDVLKA